MYTQNNDIGRTIYARNKEHVGKVKSIGRRYCAACGTVHACYNVLWDDGKTTKPCYAGVRTNEDGSLQIM